MLHAFFISARPAILPSNSRMIPDEIREKFAATTLIVNPFAFILLNLFRVLSEGARME